ncbi:MAG: hypothetical protein RMH84_06890 [Sulfolobales archaeon]|nr:hypothetical protein [Sulfolobales archaeon]MCX8208145.1 hypothetical protein [Sulfolobales archaeon]MDW8011298.1 hypothetical protein [Sulfolobales archaeon]
MLKSEDEVRKTLEELRRRLRIGESAVLEVSEDVLEFTVDEAVRQRLSVVDAREEDYRVIVVIERRHS